MPALLPSELPILGKAQHHWIVLFRPPGWILGAALGLLFVGAVMKPSPMAALFIVVLVLIAFVRWQTWKAERIYLTRRRIIRVRGVPETTTTESSLRLDRISGAVLEQTVLGKLLDYGTIELEAPGSHPDVRSLIRIAHPHDIYLQIRKVIFGDARDLDPDDGPGQDTTITEPLPFFERRTHRSL